MSAPDSRAPWLYRFVSDTSAQSETLGVVLLVGITIVGTGTVVVFGADALDATEESADLSRSEHAMTQFDSKASLVAHGTSETQRISFGRSSRGSLGMDEDAGWMRVNIVNETTGDVDETVMNETLGAVRYERGRTEITYQGGGVWRSKDGASAMISPPEFHYEGQTLTLPLVLVRGEGVSEGNLVVSQQGAPVGRYPNESQNRANPLEEGEVVVTVHSTYYRAWGRFFEHRTGGNASVDDANETATVTLVVPEEPPEIGGAITSTAPGDEIDMQGGGTNSAFVDSYNSSIGDYSTSARHNGTVITTGDVEVQGNAVIEGNVRAGGSVSLSASTSEVNGTAFWTTGFSANPNAQYDDDEQIDGVTAPDSNDAKTKSEVDSLASNNDNGGAPISGSDPTLDYTSGSVTLGPGDYYLDHIDADSKTINFDTDGNQITVGIENDVSLDDTDINVQDNGTVRIYVKDDVDIQSGSSISVSGDRSERFWFYGTHDTEFDLQGDQSNPASMVGVFYAPGTEDHSADVSIQHGELFGAVVGGEIDVETGGQVHFDEALQDVDPFPGGGNEPRVTYLHVSINEVTVTD